MIYSLGSAPSGVTLSSSGGLYWVSPVKGTYSVTRHREGRQGRHRGSVITLVVA